MAGEPGPAAMSGLPIDVDAQMQRAFLFDGNLIDGAGIRHDGGAAAQTRVFEQEASTMSTAAFLVGGDGEADGRSRTTLVNRAKNFQQYCQLPFHVSGSGTVDSLVANDRAIGRRVGERHDVQVRSEEHTSELQSRVDISY